MLGYRDTYVYLSNKGTHSRSHAGQDSIGEKVCGNVETVTRISQCQSRDLCCISLHSFKNGIK